MCTCSASLRGKTNFTSLILSMFPVPHNEINVTVPSKIDQITIFWCVVTLHSQAKNGLFLTSSFVRLRTKLIRSGLKFVRLIAHKNKSEFCLSMTVFYAVQGTRLIQDVSDVVRFLYGLKNAFRPYCVWSYPYFVRFEDAI